MNWLTLMTRPRLVLLCSVLVAGVVAVCGITRLTRSDHLACLLGLSTRRLDAIPGRPRMIRGGRAERIQVFLVALGDLARENPPVIAE